MKRIVSMAVAVALLGACGDDGPAGERGHRNARDVPVADVNVGADDYSFVGMPLEVDAGSTIALRNSSRREAHELVAFRVPDGEERSTEDLLALPLPELLSAMAGPPSLVLIAAPGADGVARDGDAVLDEPGRYLFICTVPTGADPDQFMRAAAESDGPPDVPGGPPHFAYGMAAEATVS